MKAYIAGFVDGEGCIRWTKGPRLEITNTNRPVLEEIRSYIGGEVYQSNGGPRVAGHRNCYRLTLHGSTAETALFTLLTWLVVKKAQAEAVLDMASAKRIGELTPKKLAAGLEFLKVNKQAAFDVRSDEEAL